MFLNYLLNCLSFGKSSVIYFREQNESFPVQDMRGGEGETGGPEPERIGGGRRERKGREAAVLRKRESFIKR